MSDKICQSPAVHGACDTRRSVVRLALSGVCFLGAGLLVVTVYSVARTPELPGFRAISRVCIAWAFVNVLSFGVVGVGLFCRRQCLTVIGGCILLLSTLFLLVATMLM